jgi:hypothetical protein
MLQVVSTIATLSKTTTSLSKDAKSKMVAVGKAGLASAKLSPKPITPDSASRLLAVLAAGNGVSAACKLPTGCKQSAGVPTTRHLLSEVSLTGGWSGQLTAQAIFCCKERFAAACVFSAVCTFNWSDSVAVFFC